MIITNKIQKLWDSGNKNLIKNSYIYTIYYIRKSVLMPNTDIFKYYLTSKEPLNFVPGNENALNWKQII